MKRKPTIRCHCGRTAILKPASEIYHNPKLTGYLYVCSNYPTCDSYVGTYPGTKIPMGTLADPELRKKRILAHQAFDQIWKQGIMSRNQAYRWLADKFSLPLEHTHIAQFGAYLCEQVIAESQIVLQQNRRRVCVA